MSRLFEFTIRGTIAKTLQASWKFGAGGYLSLYMAPINVRDQFKIWVPGRLAFCHRFKKKGVAALGCEKEFFLRASIELEHLQKYSWFTFEAICPYEARWFYVMAQVWPGYHISSVFNLGWRLTSESRKTLQMINLKHARDRAATVQNDLRKIRQGAQNASIRK